MGPGNRLRDAKLPKDVGVMVEVAVGNFWGEDGEDYEGLCKRKMDLGGGLGVNISKRVEWCVTR